MRYVCVCSGLFSQAQWMDTQTTITMYLHVNDRPRVRGEYSHLLCAPPPVRRPPFPSFFFHISPPEHFSLQGDGQSVPPSSQAVSKVLIADLQPSFFLIANISFFWPRCQIGVCALNSRTRSLA